MVKPGTDLDAAVWPLSGDTPSRRGGVPTSDGWSMEGSDGGGDEADDDEFGDDDADDGEEDGR